MEKYALLGYPLHHTLSPFIHERLFALSGRAADYQLAEAPAERLASLMPELLKVSGFNVTIPHKQAVIGYLDGLDESAARYRAVNAVKCGKERIGYNTDVYGFTESIAALKGDLTGKVLLLGCGGVARMMAAEVVIRGGELTIAVRSEDRLAAEELKGFLGGVRAGAKAEVVPLSDIAGKYSLLLNGTPVGMYPNTDESPVGEDVVSACSAVFEVIYNPVKTKLMRIAESLKKPVLGGMGMLVYQAARSHEIWYGASFERGDLLQLISDCNQRLKK